MIRKTLSATTLALLLAAPAYAGTGIERRHGAHVHGEGIANLAQDNGRFELELELPGANIAGFEHPPRDAAQETAIEQALEWLRDGGNWLNADPRGACEIASVNARTHGYDHNGDQGGHAHHDHHHDHDHGRDHAEFHVTAVLDCESAARLGWIELKLFERFPGNEVLVVNLFTDRGQGQARLGHGNVRIELP